jgi:hypothetical protein
MLGSVVRSPAGDLPPLHMPRSGLRTRVGPGFYSALAFGVCLERRHHRFGPAFKERLWWYEGVQEDMPFGRCADCERRVQ